MGGGGWTKKQGDTGVQSQYRAGWRCDGSEELAPCIACRVCRVSRIYTFFGMEQSDGRQEQSGGSLSQQASVTTSAPKEKEKPLTDLEKLELDRVRLDIELKELQKSLEDTLQMNDDLLADLKVKDEFLLKQDAILTVLKEKNAAEEQQLEIEHSAVTEKYGHNIDAAEKTEMRLMMHRDRFQHLEKENNELVRAINDLKDTMAEEGLQHATTIHEMNKAMGTFRKTLEKTLKQKLITIEETYQNQAFVSLNDHQKKEIFENTKLKDEVSLQGIGLANLSLRLGRQKVSIVQCAAEKKAFDRKANSLRDNLNDLQLTRMSRMRIKAELTEELDVLRAQEAAATRQLDSLPPVHDLQQDIARYLRDIAADKSLKKMWHQRGELFYNLKVDIKPVSQTERDGYFSASTFRFEHDAGPKEEEAVPASNHSQHSLANQSRAQSSMGAREDGGGGDSVKLSVVNAAIARDPLLSEALAPMRGKESLCLAEMEQLSSDDRSINLAGWLVHKILKIWRTTEQGHARDVGGFLGALGTGSLQGLGESSSIASRINTAQSYASRQDDLGGSPMQAADNPLSFGVEVRGDENDEGGGEEGAPQRDSPSAGRELFLQVRTPVRPYVSMSPPLPDIDESGGGADMTDMFGEPIESREEIEKLWDEAFADIDDASGRSGNPASSLQWYRKVPSAKRLPAGITGSSARPKSFMHDAIRPAPVNYDVGPPIVSTKRPAKPTFITSHSAGELDFGVGSISVLGGSTSLSLEVPKKNTPVTAESSVGSDALKRVDSLKQVERIMVSSSGIRLQRVSSAPTSLKKTKKDQKIRSTGAL